MWGVQEGRCKVICFVIMNVIVHKCSLAFKNFFPKNGIQYSATDFGFSGFPYIVDKDEQMLITDIQWQLPHNGSHTHPVIFKVGDSVDVILAGYTMDPQIQPQLLRLQRYTNKIKKFKFFK